MLAVAALLTPFSGKAATVNLQPAADTFMVSSAPDNNAGGDAGLTAGRDNADGIRRTLLRFDLTSIPAGSTVTAAELRARVIKAPPIGANSTFDIFRLQAEWGEGNKASGFPNTGAAATSGEATWNSRLHGSTPWTSSGALADAAATASASAPVSGIATYSWAGSSVIDDVQGWVNDAGQNFGWLLKSQDEATPKTVREFGARTSPNPAVLVVEYTATPVTNSAPSVLITRPADGAGFAAPASVLIEATAEDADGSVTGVEFFDGTESLGRDDAGPAYSFTAELFPGSHTLTAVATDNEGLAATSFPVTVTVDNTIISNPLTDRVPKGDITVEVRTIADGMASPLGMAAPDDGSGRMFVYDQDGRVWIVTADGRQPTPLLDLRTRLVTLGAYDERGLLGCATHPGFASNPRVYTYTSEPPNGLPDFRSGLGSSNNHHSVIAEWQIDAANSNLVDVSTRRELLRVEQPQSNHNGGGMRFGPDGYLYVVFGDGGQANDVAPGHVPGGNGQASNNIWGTMIRIDVSGSSSPNGQYSVPGDNPFVGTGGLGEIFAYGFRNPFAFSFDRLNGDLYLGDVGQGNIEEVDLVIAGGNYGWNIREGSFWFDGGGNLVTSPVRPVPPGLIDPIAMYDHDDGQAVIGGFVYRGSSVSGLDGRYVFGDWGSFSQPSGRLYYLDATNGVRELRLGLADRPLGLWLKGWGEDAHGEIYVFGSKALGPSGATGRMLKLVPPPEPVEVSSVGRSAGEDIAIEWSGGVGPYSVQRKSSLADPLWLDDAVSTAPPHTTAVSGNVGFFRVRDVGYQPPSPLSAYLAGDFEVPPVATPAEGRGLFGLDGNTLTFSIHYTGLSEPATFAHIHGPAGPDENGPVLIDLQPFNGGTFGTSGTLSGVIVLTDAQKAEVLGGRTYVNVHTSTHPGGEIRGQIVPVLMQVDLDGSNVRPIPVMSDGHGMGTLTLVGNTLNLNITYGGLSAPAAAAHIHGPAGADGNAGVLVNLSSNIDGALGTAGSFSGPVTLTRAQLNHLIRGLTYVNIHTATYPAGEIRGQILPTPSAVPLTASLSGLAERPVPVTNSASGSATFMLEGDRLTFNVQYHSLDGPAIAAHLHSPSPASDPAGVLIDLAPFAGAGFDTSGTLSGTVPLPPEQKNLLLGGQTYVHVHTTANVDGEIRGRVAPVLMMSNLSGANQRPSAVLTPATGLGVLALTGNTLEFVVAYGGLTSSAGASHIHGPASLFATGEVMINLAPFNGGAFGTAGSLQGATTLNPDQLGDVVDGRTYINIHTPAHPSGEIRGQILR